MRSHTNSRFLHNPNSNTSTKDTRRGNTNNHPKVAHNWSLTFTSTTTIVLRFSSWQIQSINPKTTMSSSLDAYGTLIGLRDKLTRLNSAITPEAINKLKDKIGGIFTVAQTHHYTQGQKYGHLASAIPKGKYRIVIGDATWTHTTPANPGAYSTNALTAGNAAATRKQFVAEHKVKQKSYRGYLHVEEAGKELIL